jgi:hypothetical protein
VRSSESQSPEVGVSRSCRVYVTGADADGPFSYIFGGYEAPTCAQAEEWVRSHLPELAATAPAGVRVAALLQPGQYVVTNRADGPSGRRRRAAWTIDRSRARIARLNDNGEVVIQACGVFRAAAGSSPGMGLAHNAG